MCSLFRTLQGIVRGQPTHLTTVRMRLSKKGKIQLWSLSPDKNTSNALLESLWSN